MAQAGVQIKLPNIEKYLLGYLNICKLIVIIKRNIYIFYCINRNKSKSHYKPSRHIPYHLGVSQRIGLIIKIRLGF